MSICGDDHYFPLFCKKSREYVKNYALFDSLVLHLLAN